MADLQAASSSNAVRVAGITSFAWLVTVSWLFITMVVTAMAFLSARRYKGVDWLHATSRGLLFAIAIVIAWAGVGANALVAVPNRPTQLDAMLAGTPSFCNSL